MRPVRSYSAHPESVVRVVQDYQHYELRIIEHIRLLGWLKTVLEVCMCLSLCVCMYMYVCV